MALELENLYFNDFDPNKIVRENNLADLLSVKIKENEDLSKKKFVGPTFSVDPKNKIPFPPEFDDLASLYYLCIKRKVTTILEFGVGKSTIVLAEALRKNKILYSDVTKKTLRRGNPYELHSIDNYKEWIEKVKQSIPNSISQSGVVNIHCCDLIMSTFNDRMCTYYQNLPNLCPDLIYLDGPDQFSAIGDIRGLNTKHQDRMPMSADILVFEHFLQPGTLIVVDGRTANARFLKSNLQRNWAYLHLPDKDQHYFELQEEPLGIYNRKMIDHCLGKSFYERLN